MVGRPRRLPKDTEAAIYRIVQAALNNAASHAQAQEATVAFDFGAAWLQVVIEDNGVGFDPEAVINLPGEHLGLIGMKERAEALGAWLAVKSAPGQGTRIEVRLPSPPYRD